MVAESQGIIFDELQRRIKEKTPKADFQVSILQMKRFKKILVKYGFIEEKPTQTKNNPSTKIELTLFGLFRVLEGLCFQEMADDTFSDELDNIAINQGGKLLPFMFNPYFNNRIMGQKILRSYFEFYPEGHHYRPAFKFADSLVAIGLEKMTIQDIEAMMCENFYDFVFLVDDQNHLLTETEKKLWNEALFKDKETKRHVIERLRIYRDRYAPKVDYANRRMRFFEDSQSVA